MLDILTETALLRRWAPSLYVRLCIQLLESVEDFDKSNAANYLLGIASELPPKPLLFEYIAALAVEKKSVLPLETLLERWAMESWQTRSSQMSAVISYVAKSLNPSVQASVGSCSVESISKLATQAIEGCQESLFFVIQFGQANLGSPELRKALEQLPKSDEKTFQQIIDAFGPIDPQNVEIEDVMTYTPSRMFRLLWLDEYVGCGLRYPSNDLFAEQVELLWPNDQISTVAYELAVTTFDTFASAIKLNHRVAVWQAFVSKKLPLVLKFLAQGARLDNALGRLLTTMDKEVAATVDSREARIQFVRTCIDLGLCESSVLHALHRDYTPQPENTETILDIPSANLHRQLQQLDTHKSFEESLVFKLMNAYPSLGPLSQEITAFEIQRFMKASRVNMRVLAWLSKVLVTNTTSADNLFLHISAPMLVECLMKHVDLTTSQEPSLQTYEDIACTLIAAKFVCDRYEVYNGIADQAAWKLTILSQDATSYPEYTDLSESQQNLLGNWILALLGGRGVQQGCLQSPAEFFYILPAFVVQLVNALQDQVVSREQVTEVLYYFIQNLPSCMVVVINALFYNIWEHRNLQSSVWLMGQALQLVMRNEGSASLKIVTSAISVRLHQLNELIPAIPSAESLKVLVNELIALAGPWSFSKPKINGSVAGALSTALKSLAQWQKEPVGVPAVDRRKFRLARHCFSRQKILKLIVSSLEGEPQDVVTEMEVAILVIYTTEIMNHIAPSGSIQNDIFSAHVTQIATRYVEKFVKIFQKHVEMQTEAIPEDNEAEVPIFSVPETTELHNDVSQVPAFEGDSFNYGMDLDATPMGLDELDDAMNLNFYNM